MSTRTSIDQTVGELLVHTSVAGRSARLGHRLVLAARTWHVTVDFDGDVPTGVRVTVAADSLDVISGTGGVTGLSAPERAIARGNAHRSLQVKKFPEITFASDTVTETGVGYRLDGILTICGTAREQRIDLTLTDEVVTGEVSLRQTDFAITPFSMMMGTLKVADEVRITVTAEAEAVSPTIP